MAAPVKAMETPVWIFMGLFLFFIGLGTLYYWSLLIGLMVMLGGAMLIILSWMLKPKYKANVIIAMKRKGSFHIHFDRGARFDYGDGTYYYRFQKLKDETTAINYESLYPSNRGVAVLFQSPAPKQYFPMSIEDFKKVMTKVPVLDAHGKAITDGRGNPILKEIETELATMKPIPEDLRQQHIVKQARIRQKYTMLSAWEKYYPLIVVAVLGVVMIIVISGVFNSLNPLVEAFQSSANTMAKAADTQAATTQKLIDFMAGNTTKNQQPANRPPGV
jgi:uncharacterized membrane protein YjgN (DUF898 family)